MPNALQQIPAHDGSRAGEERALRRWMQSLKRLPRLTIEEEQRLVARAQEDPASPEAQTLIERHVYLTVLTALDFRFARYGLFDMVQDGIEGLMTALERYEPERQLRFSTYARWWVRARISDAVSMHHGVMRFGTSRGHRKVLRNLSRTERALRRQGLVPSAALVARALDVREDDVTAARTFLAVAAISAESSVGQEGSASWLELHADDGPSVEAVVEARLMAERRSAAFEEFAATLNRRERMLWDERMVAEDPRTTPDLAAELGVSRQRISQVEGAVRKKLRRFVESSGSPDLLS